MQDNQHKLHWLESTLDHCESKQDTILEKLKQQTCFASALTQEEKATIYTDMLEQAQLLFSQVGKEDYCKE